MEGAIFDMDGTLIDSMSIWEKADTEFLKRYGFKPDKEYLDMISALTFEEGAEYIRIRYKINKTKEQIIDEMTEICYDEYAFNLELKEGVYDYISVLSLMGIKMAVATSCMRNMCEAVLKRNKIYDFLDALVFSDEIKSNKSEPDIYLEAAKLINVNPKNCTVFEDSVHAAKGAVKAGMNVIGVYDEYSRHRESELRSICHGFIYNFSELIK